MKLKSLVTIIAMLDVVLCIIGTSLMLSATSSDKPIVDNMLQELQNKTKDQLQKEVPIIIPFSKTKIKWVDAVLYVLLIPAQIFSSMQLVMVTSPEIDCCKINRHSWDIATLWIYAHVLYLLFSIFVEEEWTIILTDLTLRSMFIAIVFVFTLREWEQRPGGRRRAQRRQVRVRVEQV